MSIRLATLGSQFVKPKIIRVHKKNLWSDITAGTEANRNRSDEIGLQLLVSYKELQFNDFTKMRNRLAVRSVVVAVLLPQTSLKVDMVLSSEPFASGSLKTQQRKAKIKSYS